MGLSPIQPVIQPLTIDTMLNNKELNIGDGLNFVMCQQTFKNRNIYFSDFVKKTLLNFLLQEGTESSQENLDGVYLTLL